MGRLRDAHLRQLRDDYYQRCCNTMRVRCGDLRDLRALKTRMKKGGFWVALDERGETLTSRGFAQRLGSWLRQRRSPLCFAIGGADGFDEQICANSDVVLSLGSMTFAHQLVHVILAEQLYRAVSILQGNPYHRG